MSLPNFLTLESAKAMYNECAATLECLVDRAPRNPAAHPWIESYRKRLEALNGIVNRKRAELGLAQERKLKS